jgi:hypothetical protein
VAPSATLVPRLVETTPSSPEPVKDTGYMVHPPGGMLEAGKRITKPAQNRFLVAQAHHAKFSKANSLRNDLAYASKVRVLHADGT